jgi:integron integrase
MLKNTPLTTKSPKLLDIVREKIRVKHYSIRTEMQYLQWVKRFILYHNKRHPREMGGKEVEAFLSHLTTQGNVSSSTQNQALSALLFLYREVLDQMLPWMDDVIRAKKPQRLPVVLSQQDVRKVLNLMQGMHGLIARVLYGTGMRIMECCRLRVQDIDFDRGEILIRNGKGAKDRVTMLPVSLVEPLKLHLVWRRALFDQNVIKGMAEVYLPDALDKKYVNAATSWHWQYVFCSGSYSIDPRSGHE